MKRLSLFMIGVILFVTLACGSQSNTSGKIVMQSNATIVTLMVFGSGTATINWGDDSETQTILLSHDIDDTGDIPIFQSPQSNITPRTITITGENITGINCMSSDIVSIDVSANPYLKLLDVSFNQLSELDVRNNPMLKDLKLGDNNITSLDISKNPELTTLVCWGNRLTALDLSQNYALETLYCAGNELTSLYLDKNTSIRDISVSGNKITDVAMNALFSSLHSNVIYYIPEWETEEEEMAKIIVIDSNPGSQHCDPAIAESKGWEVDGFSGSKVADELNWEEQFMEDFWTNSFFVTDNDWENMSYEIIVYLESSDGNQPRHIVTIDEYIDLLKSNRHPVSTRQESVFPNATLEQVYQIVNKPIRPYYTEDLPNKDYKFTSQDETVTISFMYNRSRHLFVELLYVPSGAGINIEIIESEEETISKVTRFEP